MVAHLLVTNDFPPKTGGIQVYLYELWRRLEPGRAVVLTASSHADAAQFDADCGVRVERVAGKTLFWPSRRARRLVEEAIKRHQPELVLFDPAWPLGLLGPKLSRPYGVVLHGAEVTIPARLPLLSRSLRHVLRHAVVAIGNSAYPISEAQRNAGAAMPPSIRAMAGVDPQRFRPLTLEERQAARDRFNWARDALIVSSYSRLVPRKGMDTLIRASALLADQFPTLLVEIGGSGRDRKRLERLARRLNAPVNFFGRVADDDLTEWLGASDLMVMDCRSRWFGLEQEGFGIVFVEAAACAVAQVAGRSGGSHEAVINGETGVIVNDPKSSVDLAAAVASLLVNDERRNDLALRARQYVATEFDWDVLAAQMGQRLAHFDRFEG